MSVTVAENILERMFDDYGRQALQVTHHAPAGAAQAAMEEVARQAADLHPSAVKYWLTTPVGEFLWLDSDTSKPTARAVIELVRATLERQGIDDAVIGCPLAGGVLSGYWGLRRFPGAVCARLYPPPTSDESPPPDLPAAWFQEAYRWLRGELTDEDHVWAYVFLHEFPLPLKDVPPTLERTQHSHANFVRGIPAPMERPSRRTPRGWSGEQIIAFAEEVIGDQVRGVGVYGGTVGRVPDLKLAGGGPGASDDEVLAVFDHLRDIVRRAAPDLAYGFVSIEPRFDAFFNHFPPTEWSGLGGRPVGEFLEPVCDRIVFDAFPYQVLGPGHAERLGGMPNGAVPLGDGRFELSIGEPADWLLAPPTPEDEASPWMDLAERRRRPDMPSYGRRLLSDCLLTSGDPLLWEPGVGYRP